MITAPAASYSYAAKNAATAAAASSHDVLAEIHGEFMTTALPFDSIGVPFEATTDALYNAACTNRLRCNNDRCMQHRRRTDCKIRADSSRRAGIRGTTCTIIFNRSLR